MRTCRSKTSLIAGIPLELSTPQSSHETGKLEGLKSTEIGQSAAKARTGQRSSTIPEGSRAYIDIGSKREDLGFIYLLIDRYSGEIRYVGSTTRPVIHRLSEHLRLREDTANIQLQNWLKHSDYPIIKVLQYPKRLLYKAERYWITYYSFDNKLLNLDYNTSKQYGFKKIADKANPSKNRPCCKVNCTTGEQFVCYNSITEASLKTNSHMGNIMHVISGKRKSTGGYCWILNKI